MAAILEFFPPAAIALNEEVQKHPLLLIALSDIQKAQGGGPLDMETMIGCVAAYVNVVLDGYYLEEDLEQLFNFLIFRLKDKGIIHIM